MLTELENVASTVISIMFHSVKIFLILYLEIMVLRSMLV
jgi:hypothetical protein